jgi:hypothetical protein
MEKMKADLAVNTIQTQLLLLPEIISLVPEQLEKIKNHDNSTTSESDEKVKELIDLIDLHMTIY